MPTLFSSAISGTPGTLLTAYDANFIFRDGSNTVVISNDGEHVVSTMRNFSLYEINHTNPGNKYHVGGRFTYVNSTVDGYHSVYIGLDINDYNNFYLMNITPFQIEVIKRGGSVYSTLGTITTYPFTSVGNEKDIYLEMDIGGSATVIKVYVNGSEAGSYSDNSGTRITSPRRGGFAIYQNQGDLGVTTQSLLVSNDEVGGFNGLTVQPNNANLFWTDSWFDVTRGGSSYRQTVNPGNYCKFKFTGSSRVDLVVDSSIITALGVVANNYPDIYFAASEIVDGNIIQAGYQTVRMTTGSTVSLSTGLSASKTYQFEFGFKGVFFDISDGSSSPKNNRWNNPVTGPILAVAIKEIRLDAATTLQTPIIKPKHMLFYWDSNGEGADAAFGATGSNQAGDMDCTRTAIRALGEAENAEVHTVAFSSQGYEGGEIGYTPGVKNAWNFKASGISRLSGGLFPRSYDSIWCLHGENGGALPGTVATLIGQWRAAAPNAEIIIGLPGWSVMYGANGNNIAQVETRLQVIRDDVAAYQAAHPNDNNVHLIEEGRRYIDLGELGDAFHWSFFGHPRYATRLMHSLGEERAGEAGTPLNPVVTTNGSNNPVLSWVAATGVTGYEVLRRPTGQANWTRVTVLASNILTYTDASITSGDYQYTVIGAR